MSNEFINMMKNYNMINNNKDITTRENAILDVIYYNNPEKINYTKIYKENKEGSDHSAVSLSRTTKKMISTQSYMLYRNYKKL